MTENSIHINGFCRCCHDRGNFKSLGVPYVFENKEEIYGVLIRETLGILISPQQGENSASTYTICESCIVSLQDATRFKQQVLSCETNFTKMVIENMKVKSEYCEEGGGPGPSDEDDYNPVNKLKKLIEPQIDGMYTIYDGDADLMALYQKSIPEEERVDPIEAHNISILSNIEVREELVHNADVGENRSSSAILNKTGYKTIPLDIKFEEKKKKKKLKRPARSCSKRATERASQQTQGSDSDAEWAAPLDYDNDDATGIRKADARDVPCTICNKKFSHAGLSRHMNTHTDPRVYICHICQNKFSYGKELIEHIRIAHVKDESYPCNVCSDVFSSPELIKKHLNEHYNNELVKCHDCGRKYKRQRLQEHIRTHTERFNCDVCNKCYVGKHSLILHMRSHENKKPYICDICGQSFTLESSVKLHVLRIHSGEKPFDCKFCPKRFATKYTRDLHERQHTGLKPFVCNLCKKTFATNAVLINHVKSHKEDKPYSCGICGEQFKQPYTLKQHEIRHTGEKQFSCEICSKPFGYKGNLMIHMRIHTGETPHTCEICQEKFRAKNYLQRHLKKHTGEKYTCKICNKQVTGIYGHMKRHRDRGEHAIRDRGEHGHVREQTN